jgi:hypothetical protein
MQIFQINEELETEEALMQPKFVDKEWPENYYNVTEDDVE